MKRLRIGVTRYSSVANQIAGVLGVDPAPEVVLGRRITVTFRSIGASRWNEPQQLDYALQVAAVARQVLAGESRRTVRKRANSSAIVVIFEDATLRRGCSVTARWECVIPVTSVTPA